jgi:hypothetical protein
MMEHGIVGRSMRSAAGLIVGLALLLCGCSSRNEVLRITSPDGKVDAIAFETDCGAVCSFGYEIWLAPKGSHRGEQVAWLDAAIRNEQACGVNLKWLDADKLSVEYLRANDSNLLKQTVDVAGHSVRVSLQGGIKDPQAPAGGMLYNLH